MDLGTAIGSLFAAFGLSAAAGLNAWLQLFASALLARAVLAVLLVGALLVGVFLAWRRVRRLARARPAS